MNDNNLGTLNSLSEFPYASVNASNTVATTSFGDYAQAGTEITVTPHISESDYLQLEYSVSLSSFTGSPVTQGGTTLPPPRKSDTVQSQVTIPDGATIIVGGLNQRNFTYTKDAVPILGQIPLLEYLFSNRTKMDASNDAVRVHPPGHSARRQIRGLEVPVGGGRAAGRCPGGPAGERTDHH